MGTMLQAADLSPEDFLGYEGCNEILNVTRPDAVGSVHGAYLSAGADCVSTNSFGANLSNLGDYDIAHRIEKNWAALAPDLRGKIHLFVGTDDTFYLDSPARRLQSLLDRLQGEAQFTFIPGKTHFDLYQKGDDKYALFDQIAAEMYAVARPNANSSTNRK